MKRKFSKVLGTSAEQPGFEIDLRYKNDKESFPCAILRFEEKSLFELATKELANFEFGSKIMLQCVPFDDIEMYRNLGDNFVLAKSDKVGTMFTDDCRNWMLDEKCREQLLLRYQQETEIHSWHSFDGLQKYYCGEKQKEQNKVWCDWEVHWSPHGNFVTTFHKPGILIWGGDEMQNKRRFMHNQVTNVQFSPTEKYLVTWNG